MEGLRATDALESSLLQQAQEFDLSFECEVADFVEEERAALCEFDFSRFARDGTSEGAFFMSEEFAFDEPGRQGAAIDLDQGLGTALAQSVQGARD